MFSLNNNKNKYLKYKRILRGYTQSSYITKLDWLWLSGFIQGDGSFVIRKNRSEHILYISQSLSDIQLLYKIKSFLGVGYVRIQHSKNIAHFVVSKSKYLTVILPKLGPFFGRKKEQYLLFSVKYKCRCSPNIVVGWEDAWLSGFIDADGSFYGSYTRDKRMSSGFQLQLRFAITQKDLSVLKHIAMLFDVKVRYNKKGFYYFILSSTNLLDLVVDYLKKYPLKSKKAISFLRWYKLYRLYKDKEHLDMDPSFLKKKVKLINNDLE